MVGSGRAGPGRAAQYEIFPLVDDELAWPSASLAITVVNWLGESGTGKVQKDLFFHKYVYSVKPHRMHQHRQHEHE